MKNFSGKILYLLLLSAIISCSQKKPAAIVINSHNKYSKENSRNKKYNTGNEIKPANSAGGSVIVGSNDTVYSIAQRNNVPIRELIKENNLTPPYNLRKGSKIILPKATYHQVVSGDTLYSVSRTYNMNINDLIRINDLDYPYNIKVGSKLRITGSRKEVKPNPETNNKDEEKTAIKNLDNKKKEKESPRIEIAEEEKVIVSKENKFIWPVSGKIISKFGYKAGGLYNDGVNIKAKTGEPVHATEDGTIAYVGNELRGYGNLIIMKHSSGWISAYAHLDKFEVKRGDKVKKDHIIARVGSSGNVDTPQLYFGIRKGREAVNPELYVKAAPKFNIQKSKL